MLDTRTAIPDSALGRLLREMSWEGSKVRGYRQACAGPENVLTTEVLSALDFLPRSTFLTAVLRAAHGADSAPGRTHPRCRERRDHGPPRRHRPGP